MKKCTCSLKKASLIFTFIFGSFFSTLKAQDAYFSQFFLNPVYMNPAYAGTMKVPRVGVQYRNQWPAMNNAYTTYFASFDTYLPKISSGIGFLTYNDIQGDGIYTETSFKFLYSKEIKLSRTWTMYGSLTAGFQINSLNYNRLIFSDGLDPITGVQSATSETLPDNNDKIFPDFGTGILIFSDKYFFGLACDHLNEPNESLYSDYSSPLSRKYTMHLEINLPWYKSGRWRKYCTLNPNMILQSQDNNLNITYGLYANRRGFSLGIWNRQTTQKSNDVILMTGFMGKQLKTAITYDINIQGVGIQSHGAIEISISYLLKSPGKRSIFPFYEAPGEWDMLK